MPLISLVEDQLLQKAPLKPSHVEWSETSDSKQWDDFVVQNGGTVFHTWSWRKVMESADSRPLYLVCRDPEGRILAVCPFFYRTSRRGRHVTEVCLESLPDCRIAGPIISSLATNTSQIIASLARSVKFSLFNPVVAMEIRTHQQPIVQSMIALGFKCKAIARGILILDLHDKTPEFIWNKGFQKHDRQAIKYYEQRGAEFGYAGREDDYSAYLALERPSGIHYTINFQEEGYLNRIRSNMGDNLKLALIFLGGKAAGGFLVMCDNGTNSTVHVMAIRYSTLKNIHSLVTYLNWKTINWANENGFRYVNFGSYPVDKCSDPAHPFYKLKERFALTLVPEYDFILPTVSTPYSIAREINQAVREVRNLTQNIAIHAHRSPKEPWPS